jgi:uncharacterized membrane protein
MSTNLLTLSVFLAALFMAATVFFVSRRKFAVATFFATLLFLQTVVGLSLGMSGLRAHIEDERTNGASNEFVKGMIERDRFFFLARLSVGSSVVGLFVACLFGLNWGRRQK